MPTPPTSAAPQGDADEEFADLGGDSAGGDFDDSGDVSFDGGSADADGKYTADDFEGDDVFSEGGVSQDELTSDEAGEDQPAQEQAKSGDGKSLISKLVPLALVAGVGAVGFLGYTQVMPLLFPEEPPPPAAVAVSDPGTFPKALPGKDGGLPVSGVPSIGNPPAAGALTNSPAQPAAAPLPSQSAGQPLSPPLQGGGAGTLAQQPAIPAQGIKIPDLPATGPAAAPASPAALAAADQTDELVSGPNRGGISAQKSSGESVNPVVPAQAAVSADAEAIERRLSGLQGDLAGLKGDMDSIRREIASLTSQLNGLRSSRPSVAAGAEPARTVGPAPLPQGVVPPLKPAIVEGVTLTGVSRDVAWVRTASGVVTVRAGDEIPGAGQFVRLRPYGSDWVLVTTTGIVTR